MSATENSPGGTSEAHIGPAIQADLDRKIFPLVRELQAAAAKRNPE